MNLLVKRPNTPLISSGEGLGPTSLGFQTNQVDLSGGDFLFVGVQDRNNRRRVQSAGRP